jgi:hypothetical protein
MNPERPLAAEMQEQAGQITQLAKLVADAVPELAQALAMNAAILSLRSLRAERIERELATARRTVRELHHQAAEDADAAEARARQADPARIDQWQRRARIIADMLPGPGGCHLSEPKQ